MEYLVASSCEVVAMPESGTLMMVGLRAGVTFFKDTLDLVKIKAEVLKVGDYKSAVEPFTRTDLSPANREQIESMLDDHFDNDLVKLLIESRPARKWSAGEVKKLLDEGPFTAKKAAALGLIDRLDYTDALEAFIEKEVKGEKFQIVRNYGKEKKDDLDMSSPLAILKLLSPPKPKESKNPKIAVIYAVGAIETGKGGLSPLSGGESVGSTTMVEAIRQAEKDATVQAIVLRVDSPGGSALASDLIWNELVRCKKPVVASMGDVAASGGYYISMGCRKIYAEPGTLTGSIGVFGLKLITGGLTEWAGMKTVTIQRGQNAGIMTTNRPYTDSERKAMTAVIEDIYDQFTTKAVQGRQKAGVKMDREQLLKLAGGRVWTGRQAKERGLVDELGTLDDAIAAAKTMAGIDPTKEMEILQLPKPTSILDKLMDGDLKSPFGSAKALDEVLQIPGANTVLREIAPLLRDKDPIKAMIPYRIEVK
jgi:protease-4